jgi:hypothetical protein
MDAAETRTERLGKSEVTRKWKLSVRSVETLREEYGERFAPGVRSDAKLGTVKERENASTLDDLLRKYGIRHRPKG